MCVVGVIFADEVTARLECGRGACGIRGRLDVGDGDEDGRKSRIPTRIRGICRVICDAWGRPGAVVLVGIARCAEDSCGARAGFGFVHKREQAAIAWGAAPSCRHRGGASVRARWVRTASGFVPRVLTPGVLYRLQASVFNREKERESQGARRRSDIGTSRGRSGHAGNGCRDFQVSGHAAGAAAFFPCHHRARSIADLADNAAVALVGAVYAMSSLTS